MYVLYILYCYSFLAHFLYCNLKGLISEKMKKTMKSKNTTEFDFESYRKRLPVPFIWPRLHRACHVVRNSANHALEHEDS